MRNSILGALLSVALGTSLAAQAEPARPPLFTRKDAMWAGAALLGSIALSTADVRIAAMWNDSTHRDKGRDELARRFAKAQEGTLFVGNMALWGIGRLAKVPALADVTFHAAEAVFVGSLASQVIRGPLGRSRPHVTAYKDQYDFSPFTGFKDFDHRAFPSIHTASAFAVATIYTMETKRRAPGATWVVGPLAYALALGPGVSRMYTGQHWASDVLGGAFMGTFAAAKLMKYNHEVRPDNGVNRFFLGAKNVQVGVSSSGFSATYAKKF